MKLKKVCALLMTALLCTVSVLGNTQAESRSNDLVVFVSGSSGNNSNPGTLESPKQTFGGAVALFSAKGCGGTIVVVDDINVGPWVATKLPGKVTVTSRYNGVDYRAKMNFGATGKKAVLVLQSEMEFNHITFNHVFSACSELWTSSHLEIGEEVRVLKNGEDTIGRNDFAIRIGSSLNACDSASVSVKSGTFSYISGGNNANSVSSSLIHVEGNAKIVAYIQGGGTNRSVSSSVIDLQGGKIPVLYVNGYGSAAMETSQITIGNNAEVSAIFEARTEDSSGKVTNSLQLTVNGKRALESIRNLDVQSVSGILGASSLTINDAQEAVAKFNLSSFDQVALSNATVYLKNSYQAPAGSLTIGEGSVLYLTSDTDLPQWSGKGSVVLEPVEWPVHDYSGKSYDDSVYLSFEKSESSQQGMAVYGNYAFLFYHGGFCDVIDLATREKAGSFYLGSSTGNRTDAYSNHVNQAVFSQTFYEEEDAFPLLYVTSGNAGGADEDGYYGRCAVERITMKEQEDGTLSFSSELMQTIIFNDNDYETGNNFKYTKPEVSQYESPCWGWPASFADTDNNRFYLFSARYRTSGAYAEYYDQNAYIVTSFLLPPICTVGETVILYPEDIVDQFTTEFDVFVTQGGTLYDGKIYYTYGFGGLEYPNAIRVFDLAEKKIVAKIDLSDSIFSNEEIESCGVYEGTLLCNTNSGKIYQLDYIESLWKEEPATGQHYTECCICGERLQTA